MTRLSELSSFDPLPELKDVYVARKTGLRCTAIKLRGGGVCLFNPVSGLGTEAIRSLAEIGSVTHLLAPNHYHNKGVGEYAKAFPDALLCASVAAAPRLAKQTGLDFTKLTDVASRLPKGITILKPLGLKTGEIWLRAKAKNGWVWFVVDALAGPKMTATSDRGSEPAFLKTFPNFGVSDAAVYTSWFYKQLRKDNPGMVVPCHGRIFAAGNLSAQIDALMRDHF